MDVDRNILDSVANIRMLGAEINALKLALDSLLQQDSSHPVAFDNSTNDKDYLSADGWVCEGCRWAYTARRRKDGRGKRAKAGSLSILVDLGHEGHPASSFKFPVLLAAWTTPEDSWEETLDGENSPFWPITKREYEIRADRLSWWVGTKEDECDPDANRRAKAIDASWFFVVPLIAIKEKKDLQRLVISPVMDLLAGKEVAKAFARSQELARIYWRDGESASAGRS